MNRAIAGTEMEKGQCRRNEKYKGKKEHTSTVGEDLSIRRDLFFRFGEIGIQFGSPDRKRSLVRRGTLNTLLSEKRLDST